MNDEELADLDIPRVSYKGKLSQFSESCGWALCVGAGVSKPLFPDWNALAERLLAGVPKRKFLPDDRKALVKEFGAAAAIQAAARFTGNDSQFRNAISKALYGPLQGKIKKKFGVESWTKIESKAFSGATPQSLSTADKWEEFVDHLLEVRKGDDSSCSAFGIAEAIAEVFDTERRPQAILSFNAETLLYALINAFVAKLAHAEGEKLREKRPLVRMIHDLSQRQPGRIPFYYIHGLVSIPDQFQKFGNAISSDKLIFSEGQYLNLSSKAYSWQSTNFLSVCLHHRCVFVGLSFTDPNLRRWLAWQHESRTVERRAKDRSVDRHQHYWFKRDENAGTAKMTANQILQQASVDHLGVRIIWIKDYAEVGVRIREMLEPITT